MGRIVRCPAWHRTEPVTPCCGSQPFTRQQHDNQHEEKEPAKTTPHSRATQVKPTSAEQHQKDNQDNDQIQSALLSDFGEPILARPIDRDDIRITLSLAVLDCTSQLQAT